MSQIQYRKPSTAQLEELLTPQQYSCTQEGGTEVPFHNAYWDEKADGLYVDVVSGLPLFSSLDKFDSKTGWPSFTQAVGGVSEHVDASSGVMRTEVRSTEAASHLGHVFDDGPEPTGKRYCINSAALRFIPLEELQEKKLGAYLFAFAPKKHWQIATVAGGCFWGVEELTSKIAGVLQTRVGYAGGAATHTSYQEVCSGKTGHAEVVQILFDPARLSYESILLFFFRMHDPTTLNRQGNDRGSQYRSAIFYADATQKKIAEAVIARVNKSNQFKTPVTTQLAPLKHFVLGEPYHQHYLDAHPDGYRCHKVHDYTF